VRLNRLTLRLKERGHRCRFVRRQRAVSHTGGQRGVRFPAREPAEVDRALADIAAAQVGAVNVLASPFLNFERGLIVGRLNDARLPAIYQWPETAIEGGCLAYGPRLASCYRQLASLVVKVLRGGRPADLPIEQPTKFDLLVNLRTAKAIGLHVPATLLLRADEVIE
jgi:putative tryptophan/tyrosine transport system substrate-binding protein